MQTNKFSFTHKEAKLLTSCKLFKDAKNIVVGSGPLNAKIMFIGEAPGKNEDENATPFCGQAGKNLDKLLSKASLTRDQIYITNILKLRPPKNRDPKIEEIKIHSPWLLKQIRQIKPKIICTLGNYATKFFLSEFDTSKIKSQPGITKIHGKPFKIKKINAKIIPLFHPAAIIYNRKLEPLWIKDIEIVKKELKLQFMS